MDINEMLGSTNSPKNQGSTDRSKIGVEIADHLDKVLNYAPERMGDLGESGIADRVKNFKNEIDACENDKSREMDMSHFVKMIELLPDNGIYSVYCFIQKFIKNVSENPEFTSFPADLLAEFVKTRTLFESSHISSRAIDQLSDDGDYIDRNDSVSDSGFKKFITKYSEKFSNQGGHPTQHVVAAVSAYGEIRHVSRMLDNPDISPGDIKKLVEKAMGDESVDEFIPDDLKKKIGVSGDMGLDEVAEKMADVIRRGEARREYDSFRTKWRGIDRKSLIFEREDVLKCMLKIATPDEIADKLADIKYATSEKSTYEECKEMMVPTMESSVLDLFVSILATSQVGVDLPIESIVKIFNNGPSLKYTRSLAIILANARSRCQDLTKTLVPPELHGDIEEATSFHAMNGTRWEAHVNNREYSLNDMPQLCLDLVTRDEYDGSEVTEYSVEIDPLTLSDGEYAARAVLVCNDLDEHNIPHRKTVAKKTLFAKEEDFGKYFPENAQSLDLKSLED